MLNMGIIGMGKMGEFHADWIVNNKDMKLVAICEKNKKRIDGIRKKYNVDVYDDIDKFLNLKKMDFVVIVTTNETHEELTVKSLEKDKNVIVEKPMCMNYEGALRMVKAAEKKGKHLFVHQSSRWDRDYLLVKEIINSGMIGDVLNIQSKIMLYGEGWPDWGIDGMANPWRAKAGYGGGMLYDWGVHLVDEILTLVKSKLIGVYGVFQSGVWSTEVEDYFLAILRYDNNLICQLEVGNSSLIPLPRWYVIGTEGNIEVKGKNDDNWDEAEVIYIRDNGKKEGHKIKLYGVCESGLEGGFYEDLVPFLNGEKKEFVSMYETAEVVKILDLIKRSSEENRFLEFK